MVKVHYKPCNDIYENDMYPNKTSEKTKKTPKFAVRNIEV